MIKLITNNPIAVDSDDHIHPDGIYLDNNINHQFVDDVENYFKREKINMLDLGCAGGELICKMFERGHNSVGLEGSDHCINVRQEMVQKFGREPLGLQNWKTHYNSRLFTCDITKPYQILENDEQMKFDLITCFDVMEHFREEEIEIFFKMVQQHLKPNGIFVASIALFNLTKDAGVNWHKSVQTSKWWMDKNADYLKEVDYPFTITNRGQRSHGSSNIYVYAGVLK
jgi:SAM-dependent methyltransferase